MPKSNPRSALRFLPVLAAAVPYASLAAAYSWNFKSTPRQCQNLSIEISGSGGKAPYNILLIPVGPSTTNKEVRKITEVEFNSSTSLDFQLKWPENSQFVAVVSDANGFGTGGTSAAVTVLDGDDGCFDPNVQVEGLWFFHTTPDKTLITCTPSRLWWNDGDVQGTPTFQGVIPGGQSFQIPNGDTSTISGQGIGFDWTPSVRSGTQLILVAGDDRGLGTGGSNGYTLQEGNSNSCLNGTSPSSTPGSPAGGSYPTATDGSGVGSGDSGSSSHTNVGAIVGGVIGGVVGAVAIGLVLLFVMRRQRFHHKTQKERPVDLLNDAGDGAPGDGRLPEYYQPEPFILPDPTVASTHESSSAAGSRPMGSARQSADRRQSYLSTSTSDMGGGYLRAGGSSHPSTSTRKSPAPPTFRPVNIIQHDDAGPQEAPPPADDEEPETIELPPAYTNIKRDIAHGEGTSAAEPATSTSPA